MARHKRKKLPKDGSSNERDICFTIMPFGGWLDDYYETIYKPAIESAGLEPHRADDLFRPSTIVNDIWDYTKRAKILLADLTGKNPNVFYELGLAHALAKPAILVAGSMDEIPFDLRALRIIIYDKNAPDWGRLLKDKIALSIKEVLRAPVSAVLPAFLEVTKAVSKPIITPHEKELIELKQEMDLLRQEIQSRYDKDGVIHSSDSLEPDEARRIIQNLITFGLSDRDILNRLQHHKIPRAWTIREVKLARERRRKGSSVVLLGKRR